jgi:hypothetical protein
MGNALKLKAGATSGLMVSQRASDQPPHGRVRRRPNQDEHQRDVPWVASCPQGHHRSHELGEPHRVHEESSGRIVTLTPVRGFELAPLLSDRDMDEQHRGNGLGLGLGQHGQIQDLRQRQCADKEEEGGGRGHGDDRDEHPDALEDSQRSGTVAAGHQHRHEVASSRAKAQVGDGEIRRYRTQEKPFSV